MDMNASISILKHTFEIALSDIYPDISVLNNWYYTFDDILNQLIFELIKEEYKKHAEKHSVQYFLRQYKDERGNRAYTRAIQYSQFYRDFTNNNIEETLGFRLPELEPQDVTGSSRFDGHQFTEADFTQLKMQADCRLLNKLHGKQVDNSKNVTESYFIALFQEYAHHMSQLEPLVSAAPSQIISRALAYGMHG